MVIVPTLLDSIERINDLVAHLEVQALGNVDAHIHFALLSDFVDASNETLPGDVELLAAARAGIAQLNARHADGRPVPKANLAGQKLLREWSRTLHMIRPSAMLIAEDHTGWDAVTKLPAQGGLGFNARVGTPRLCQGGPGDAPPDMRAIRARRSGNRRGASRRSSTDIFQAPTRRARRSVTPRSR